MKATEQKIQPILEGTKQFIVPLYQRGYSWKLKHWQDLWEDLVDIYESSPRRTHFIGSIVTAPTQTVPEGIPKFLLIDGQQRLTTLLVLLAVIRDLAKSLPPPHDVASQEIQALLLTNQFQKGLDLYKLLPTKNQDNRDSFLQMVSQGTVREDDRIGQAYRYFERQLRRPGAPPLEELKTIIVRNLLLVSIVLDRDDNPHVIFETLNWRGEPLSQADLIRNYFLMRIHVDHQDEFYQEIWRPMQDRLGDEALPEFIRHFLMRSGSFVRQTDVYFALKQIGDSKDASAIVEYMRQLSQFSQYYARILAPEKAEANPAIQERMTRLNRIEITTTYPFLLNVYHEHACGRLGTDALAEILDTIENFMIRRWVCGVQTYTLNKMFPPLFGQAKPYANLAHGVKEVLRTKNYPRDQEFRQRLVEGRLYGAGERLTKTKLLLERLETSYGHKETPPLGDLTIEHIMPQTLNTDWKHDLGTEADEAQDLWLHSLGNLSLTAYNPDLSNSSFERKKLIYRASNVQITKSIPASEKWDIAAIRARGEHLAERALTIWRYFGPRDEPARPENLKNRVPQSVTICGQAYEVKTWRDVAQRTLEAICDLGGDAVEVLLRELPKLISETGAGFRSSRQLNNGLFMETHLSAKYIQRYCAQATALVGLSQDDWSLELVDANPGESSPT